MTDERIDEALAALGSSEVAPPDADFAAGLEDRLLDQHRRASRPRVGSSTRSAGAPRLPLRAAAVAGAALVAGATYALTQPEEGATTQLTSATDTSVVLPDGSVVAASAGDDLPDGAMVITGPDGSASVDGTKIPGSSQAVIDDGGARVVPPSTTTTTREDSATSAPPPTRPVEPTTTTPPPDPTTTAPTASARLDLRAERVERAVGLRWSVCRATGFAQYRVVRTVGSAGGAPEETTVVFTSAERDALTFRDRLPVGAEQAGYRVLAVDRTGRVVAASPLVRV